MERREKNAEKLLWHSIVCVRCRRCGCRFKHSISSFCVFVAFCCHQAMSFVQWQIVCFFSSFCCRFDSIHVVISLFLFFLFVFDGIVCVFPVLAFVLFLSSQLSRVWIVAIRSIRRCDINRMSCSRLYRLFIVSARCKQSSNSNNLKLNRRASRMKRARKDFVGRQMTKSTEKNQDALRFDFLLFVFEVINSMVI